VSYGSDVAEFIYVRVPRTGSGTFCKQLEEQFDCLVDVGPMHGTSELLKKLWGSKWDEYFTFGFVRNPWEWMVSVYNSGIPARNWPGARIEPHDAPGIHPGQRMNHTFDEWIYLNPMTQMEWLIGVDRIYRFEDYIVGNKTKENAISHSHYREWYSTETANYVGSLCAPEIIIGNYRF